MKGIRFADGGDFRSPMWRPAVWGGGIQVSGAGVEDYIAGGGALLKGESWAAAEEEGRGQGGGVE